MLGQRARAGGAGQHARQVQHAHAGQRPVARRQRFRRRVADADDLQQRQRGDGGGLRMLRPLRVRAHHAAGALGGDDRLLQVQRVPVSHCLATAARSSAHAQHAQRGGAMVGEVAVQVAPAAILGGIDAHDRIARVSRPRRRPASCSGRCAATPWPGAHRRPRTAAARCAVSHRSATASPSRPGSRRRPRRCGTASAGSDRCRR